MIPVSAKTGKGIEPLIAWMEELRADRIASFGDGAHRTTAARAARPQGESHG
jgi:hypothetical protein